MAADESQRLLPLEQRSAAKVVHKPAPKSIILSVCSFILTAEFCLCLSSATLTGSLPIYFRKNLGLDSVKATELNTLLTCLFNLTPILGAYVADTHLGRFKTIAIACVAYIVGLVLCTIASTETFSSYPLFFFGLYGCITVAAGGIKPNVVVLGADQFDLDVPAQRLEKESFFNWFYWSINIGSFISYSVLANIAVNGLPPYIPESEGFAASFCFATVVYVIGAFIFFSGKSRYRRLPPKGSVLASFFRILAQAGGKSLQGKLVVSGGIAFVSGILLTSISYFIEHKTWHMVLALSGAASVVYGTIVLILAARTTQWVHRASSLNGGSFNEAQVKDASQVVRLMPYMSIIILFWASYSQMSSNFVLQGCQMDLRVRTTLISPATLSILNSGAILIFIPIFDRIIYPFMGAIGFQPTLLRKIGAGLFFSLVAMLVAAWIEVERKQQAFVGGDIYSNCASSAEHLPMSQISIWWQAAQYLLVGISEILTSITSYDLFYSEVPETMRSACAALNLLAITLGYIVSGALNSIFSFWVTTDLNEGKLENIFLVVAALLLVNLVAFVFVSRSFKYHIPPPESTASLNISGFSPAVTRAARAVMGVVEKSPHDLSRCQASFSMAVTCQPGTLHDETARLLPLPSPLRTQAVPPLSIDGINNKGSILTRVCLPILVLEFSLWVALATLTGTLPIYLRKHLGIDSVRATEINYAFHTLGNLAPIGGGYLADQHLGRVPTILLACGMLTTGLTFCMIAAHPSVASVELLMVGLFGGVGLAQGGTGPCIVVLGADQFDETVASQRVEKQSFFNWFYWSINVGSTVSFAFLSNLAVNGLASIAVSPRMGFFAAYAVATLVFASGSLLFFRGRHRFRTPPPTENVLSIFLSQLLAVCKLSTRGWLVLSGLAAFLPGILLTTASYFVATSSSWHLVLALSGAAAVVYGAVVLITTCSSTMWIDDLNHSHRGVPDVACVLRLLPYMSIIVVFWATYSQMETNFILQGCQMDLRLGGHSLISSSMLTIVDTAVILLFIPVFDRVVYPQLTSLGVVPTTLRKIGVDLIFSLLAMLSAAWIEVERKRREAVVGVGSNCADEASSARLPMAQMSIVWQAVPYLLIGLSEILTSIAAYDLFYAEVPPSMRSACQSLNLLTTTLGYIVGGSLNSIFSFWVTSDLNDGKLEYIFYIMAALVALSGGVFLIISRQFVYSADEPSSDVVADY